MALCFEISQRPINWAINGESETGGSIITLADRMDAGLILSQVRTLILPGDNFPTLHDRGRVSAAAGKNLDAIENTASISRRMNRRSPKPRN
jgi:methionyl-tRNA formyltransferase